VPSILDAGRRKPRARASARPSPTARPPGPGADRDSETIATYLPRGSRRDLISNGAGIGAFGRCSGPGGLAPGRGRASSPGYCVYGPVGSGRQQVGLRPGYHTATPFGTFTAHWRGRDGLLARARKRDYEVGARWSGATKRGRTGGRSGSFPGKTGLSPDQDLRRHGYRRKAVQTAAHCRSAAKRFEGQDRRLLRNRARRSGDQAATTAPALRRRRVIEGNVVNSVPTYGIRATVDQLGPTSAGRQTTLRAGEADQMRRAVPRHCCFHLLVIVSAPTELSPTRAARPGQGQTKSNALPVAGCTLPDPGLARLAPVTIGVEHRTHRSGSSTNLRRRGV